MPEDCLAHVPSIAAHFADHLKLGDAWELAAWPCRSHAMTCAGRLHIIGTALWAADRSCLLVS